MFISPKSFDNYLSLTKLPRVQNQMMSIIISDSLKSSMKESYKDCLKYCLLKACTTSFKIKHDTLKF